MMVILLSDIILKCKSILIIKYKSIRAFYFLKVITFCFEGPGGPPGPFGAPGTNGARGAPGERGRDGASGAPVRIVT